MVLFASTETTVSKPVKQETNCTYSSDTSSYVRVFSALGFITFNHRYETLKHRGVTYSPVYMGVYVWTDP